MGSAILFVCLLVVAVVLAILVWVFLSRCIVVVVEETAAGNDNLVWPDEPPLDWLWMAVYVAWLVGIWLVPAFFIARFASHHMDTTSRAWTYAALVLATFWLTFPFSLLSTMSAESRWTIF